MTNIVKIHKNDSANILLQMEDMYEGAFKDAIPFDMLRSLDGDCPEVSIDAIIDDDDVYGFAYTLTRDWMTYIMCLVIREDMRDRGYGTMLLSHIKGEAFDSAIPIITADIEGYDNDEPHSIKARRAAFYKNNGMVDIGKSAFDDGKQCIGDRLMCITDGSHSYNEICDVLRTMINDMFNINEFHEIGTPLHNEGTCGFILMLNDDDLPDDEDIDTTENDNDIDIDDAEN